MERNPVIRLRKCEPMGLKRADALNEMEVKRFFASLESLIEKQASVRTKYTAQRRQAQTPSKNPEKS
jgi:hypothetical protein